MRRRDFITLLSGAAAAWPLATRAQRPTVPVIGFLNGASAWEYSLFAAAFRQGLADTGFVEDRDVLVEYRWAEGHYERLPSMAVDLVRRQVAVIVTGSTPAALAAKGATSTIPIVFSLSTDPVALGLVAGLNRPGGNLTGVTDLAAEVGPKMLQLLHEAVPGASVIALLLNPNNPALTENFSREMDAAAKTLGVQLRTVTAGTERDFDAAFASLRQLGAGALVLAPDVFFNSRSQQLAELAASQAMPAILQNHEFAVAGGLMSYADSRVDSYRRIGIYAARILRGEKPGDLPVQQATKIELTINLKTAKALALTIPLSLLGRAEEVIE
jgi:putative ABC transport system substrate-binding protein